MRLLFNVIILLKILIRQASGQTPYDNNLNISRFYTLHVMGNFKLPP